MAVANPTKNDHKNHYLNLFEFWNSDSGAEERVPHRTTTITIYILKKPLGCVEMGRRALVS